MLLWLLFACSVLATAAAHSTALLAASAAASTSSLQTHHFRNTPAETLRDLATACDRLGVTNWDVYGDFNTADSYLRRFESELADEFGMDDAVFMPSGVMAQSIALLIHHHNQHQAAAAAATKMVSSTDGANFRPAPAALEGVFACHSTSHLLLHEKDSYSQLLNMKALVIASSNTETNMTTPKEMSIPPMKFEDVKTAMAAYGDTTTVSTLILELPHREIGGKLTPWEDIEQMRDYCRDHDIRFHCDGARIFEAAACGYYNDKTLQELVAPFDSVYISFYKGLGGLAGAALLGSTSFCSEARVWLRRFGGNIYTMLPYIVSGMTGYHRYWKMDDDADSHWMSFAEKKQKLIDIITLLQQDTSVNEIVCFDPAIPETNMVHGYLFSSKQVCEKALTTAADTCGIRVLHRVTEIPKCDAAFAFGYRTKFEWTMGEMNGRIPRGTFNKGWHVFAETLLALTKGSIG